MLALLKRILLGTGRALFFLSLFPLSMFIHGVNIEKGKSVPIDEDIIFKYPSGIVIIHDQAIISDIGTCKLNVISLKNGKLLKEFGRMGVGPDEFSAPSIRDAAFGELAITNLGRNMNYFYLYNDQSSHFAFFHRYGKGGSVFDIKILKYGVYLFSTLDNRCTQDGRNYVLATISASGEKKFILDIDESFGEKTNFNRKDKSAMPTIGTLPPYNMCCFNKKWYMYNWVGNLNPVIIDRINNKKIPIKLQVLLKYIKPKNYHLFEMAMKKMDKKLYWQEMEKYSWVMYNFLTDSLIGLVYATYYPDKEAWLFRVALFSHEGDLLLDKELSGIEEEGGLNWPGAFFFDREMNVLYGLAHKIKKDFEDEYSIVSCRIVE